MLRTLRQQLHERIALLLISKYPKIAHAQPGLVARHFSEAGVTSRAVEYWLIAGQQAMRRSAIVEAERLFRKGLHLVPTLPDVTQRQQYELDLQMALGRALVAIRGHGAPVISEVYGRARQLYDQLGSRQKLLPVLWGQWTNLSIRGDLEKASQLAAELRKLADTCPDAVTLVTACRASGFTDLFSGNFFDARVWLERGLSCYDPKTESQYLEVSPAEPVVLLLVYLSIALICCGYFDQAWSNWNAAVARARQLHHDYTLVLALAWGWRTRWLLGSSPVELLQQTDEILALTANNGLQANARAAALSYRGWCLTVTGGSGEGISLLSTGLAELRKLGYSLTLPHHLVIAADAYRVVGKPAIALTHLAEAHRLAKETHARWVLAETLRLQGDLLVGAGDQIDAETSFLNAVHLARNQDAKLFEIRASTSLARLWRDQGRVAEAHDLLAPIYSWFTEGFDVPDLIEAKALLDELEAALGRSPTAAMVGARRS